MAFDPANVVPEMLTAIQERFVRQKRVALDYNALRMGFLEGEVAQADDIKAIAAYLEALPWVEYVRIVWDSAQITVLPAVVP